MHMIAKADQDNDQHDHPWNFFSFIVKGGYCEKVGHKYVHRDQFSIAHRKATEVHKVVFLDKFKPVYTLVLTYGTPRTWGYKTKKGWIPFDLYRKNKHSE